MAATDHQSIAQGVALIPTLPLEFFLSFNHTSPMPTKKNWIAGAIKPSRKGALHKALHVPQGQKIPASKLNAAAKKGGKLGKMANLAKTLSGFKKK